MSAIIIGVIAIIGLGLTLGIVAKVSNIFNSVSPLLKAIKGTDFEGIEAE